jgi:serine/threonine-protein kinase RsbW
METLGTLRLDARLEDLPHIRQFFTKTTSALDIDHRAIYDLNLAITELITNTLLYGYGGAGPIEIKILRAGQDLLVRLRDKAPYFDPTGHPPPDITQPLEKRPPGGMGVYLTRLSVDRFSHRRLPGDGNEITLGKVNLFPPAKEE